jgi:serine/threonine protein kinase
VLQTSDVWSLGCVLSVVATYLVLGLQSVRLYQSIRERGSPTPGDTFHDGKHVLPIVTEWHRYLKASCRHTDVFTAKILNMVDEDMLVPEDRRKCAKDVADVFASIMKTQLPDEDFPQVQTLLKELDKEERDKKDRESLSSVPAAVAVRMNTERQNSTAAATTAPHEPVPEESPRSRPVQLTAKRQNVRMPPSRQEDLAVQPHRPLRKILSDPPAKPNRWTNEEPKPKSKLGLEITTSLQDAQFNGRSQISPEDIPAQSLFQMIEELAAVGSRPAMRSRGAARLVIKRLRSELVNKVKGHLGTVKGKMKDDHFLIPLFEDRDIVSRIHLHHSQLAHTARDH